MKIAILNWRDRFHETAGGAERFVHEVGRRWVAEGHEVTLFSSLDRSSSATENDSGIQIHRVGHLRRGSHHFLAPRAAARALPDVVLESINTIPYQLPSRRSFPPFLPLVHQFAGEVWHHHAAKPLAAIAEAFEPRLYRRYRHVPVTCVSASTAADLQAVGVSDVTVLPQGGLGRQEPTPRSNSTPPTMIFVGRLEPNKRPDHALDAFRLVQRELPKARLWVIGSGSMKKRLIRDLPPGAELLGRVDDRELKDRLTSAHLLLVTSVKEGWGLVVTEAAALGTPTVAYDVAGVRDSVRDNETGCLTESSPRALAGVTVSLLRDIDTLAGLRTRAMEWGARFTWDRTAAALLAELERARSGQLAHSA